MAATRKNGDEGGVAKRADELMERRNRRPYAGRARFGPVTRAEPLGPLPPTSSPCSVTLRHDNRSPTSSASRFYRFFFCAGGRAVDIVPSPATRRANIARNAPPVQGRGACRCRNRPHSFIKGARREEAAVCCWGLLAMVARLPRCRPSCSRAQQDINGHLAGNPVAGTRAPNGGP